MSGRPPFTPLVRELPASVPFVAPEALERRRGGPFRLRLGANESPFGASPGARRAMSAAADRVWLYCDPESYELREELARRHGVGMENLAVGSGIDDLLGLIVRTFLAPGETAVTSIGGYPTFDYHVAAYGGRLRRMPRRADGNDLEGLAEAAAQGARLVYLANPDNPTGTWHTASDLRAFRARLPGDCLLILDQAYVEFAPPGTVYPSAPGDPAVLALRTFSKAYGMAGARIGYAVAGAETIAAFDKVRLHFGVNLVAQAGALAALKDERFLDQVVAAVAQGREEYAALGRELGLPPLPSATNFVSLDAGSGERAKALLERLADEGVFIRVPGAPALDRCVRVTVGLPEQRQEFAEILRQVMAVAPLPAATVAAGRRGGSVWNT